MDTDFQTIKAAASAAEGATSGAQMEEAFNRNFEKAQSNFTELHTDKAANSQTLTDAAASATLPATSGAVTALLQTVRNCLKWLTGMFNATTGHRHNGTDSRRVAYSDLTGAPAIPAVNNATITLQQGGQTKGTFTLNQTAAQTINLDAGGSTGGGGSVTVVDGLASTSATAALSANQGRVLDGKIDGLIQAFASEAAAQTASAANPTTLCVY